MPFFSELNLFPFKIYAVFLTIAFLSVGGYFLVQFETLRRRMIEERYQKERPRILASEDLKKRINILLELKKSNDVNELKVAIVEGDTLAEELLRMQGFQGESMAALLSEASLAGLVGIDKLWRFHRLRNVLVHDSTFVLGVKRGQETLRLLEEAIEVWGVMPRQGLASGREVEAGGE